MNFGLRFLPLPAIALHFLILPADPLSAAPAVEITVQGRSGHALHLRPLSGPNAAAPGSTLDADLRQGGHFHFQSTPQNAFDASGAISGGILEGTLRAPNGGVLFSRSYRTGNQRRDAHRFADDIVEAVTGRPGIASSQIVFIAERSGHKELFVCDYDGANPRQITRDASISVSPSISPDGRRVAYTSYRSGYPDVYVIDLTSGARTRIIKSPGTNSGAAYAPSGDRLALSMSFSGNPELYITGSDGGRARRVTDTPAIDSSPTWFPGSDKLIFVSNPRGNPQLHEISARGGSARHLDVGFSHCTSPDLSPDGKRLAFNVRTPNGTAIAILEFDSGQTRILPASAGAEDPCWGPDSRHLLFARDGDLYLRNAEAIAAGRIVTGFGRITEPGWSR